MGWRFGQEQVEEGRRIKKERRRWGDELVWEGLLGLMVDVGLWLTMGEMFFMPSSPSALRMDRLPRDRQSSADRVVERAVAMDGSPKRSACLYLAWLQLRSSCRAEAADFEAEPDDWEQLHGAKAASDCSSPLGTTNRLGRRRIAPSLACTPQPMQAGNPTSTIIRATPCLGTTLLIIFVIRMKEAAACWWWWWAKTWMDFWRSWLLTTLQKELIPLAMLLLRSRSSLQRHFLHDGLAGIHSFIRRWWWIPSILPSSWSSSPSRFPPASRRPTPTLLLYLTSIPFQSWSSTIIFWCTTQSSIFSIISSRSSIQHHHIRSIWRDVPYLHQKSSSSGEKDRSEGVVPIPFIHHKNCCREPTGIFFRGRFSLLHQLITSHSIPFPPRDTRAGDLLLSLHVPKCVGTWGRRMDCLNWIQCAILESSSLCADGHPSLSET